MLIRSIPATFLLLVTAPGGLVVGGGNAYPFTVFAANPGPVPISSEPFSLYVSADNIIGADETMHRVRVVGDLVETARFGRRQTGR